MSDIVRNILTDLERTRENLLALSDDIWLSIDHNSNDALRTGTEFKAAYNNKMTAFDLLATELSELVQQFTDVRIEVEESPGNGVMRTNALSTNALSRRWTERHRMPLRRISRTNGLSGWYCGIEHPKTL